MKRKSMVCIFSVLTSKISSELVSVLHQLFPEKGFTFFVYPQKKHS